MHCTNNLKQMGLAVHNFHDVNNSLPPICIFASRPTIHMLLLPYMEATAIHDMLVENKVYGKSANAIGSDTNDTVNIRVSRKAAVNGVPNIGGGDFTLANNILEQMFMSTYICPSSVHPNGGLRLMSSNDGGAGPCTDYAALIVKNVNRYEGGWSSRWMMKNNTDSGDRTKHNTAYHSSPFTIANVICTMRENHNEWGPGKVKDWTYDRPMSYWADGTSNQLCFAEKHITKNSQRVDGAWEREWDGGYNNVDKDHIASAIARIVTTNANLVAKNPEENDNTRPQDSGVEGCTTLGSSHPAVFNALVGDGSVHSISKTVSPQVLCYLTHCFDGVAQSLP